MLGTHTHGIRRTIFLMYKKDKYFGKIGMNHMYIGTIYDHTE